MSAGPSLQDRDPRRGSGRRRKRTRGGAGGGGGRRRRIPAIVKYAGLAVVVLGIAGLAALAGMFAYYGSDPRLPRAAGE